MTSLSHLTVDELADGICLRAGRIAAAEAELLAWIGEFDERQGWAGPGMLSCAHWLSWRTGLGPGAARERVRVAARLRALPALAEAFGAGLASWTQVRAVTRVADAEDGIDWVSICRSTSGAQIEKLVRGIARATAPARASEDCERAAWLVRTRRRYDDDGNLVLTLTVRPEAAPVIEAALEAKRAQLERDVPAGTPELPLDEAQAERCAAHADRPWAACASDPGPAGTPTRVSDGDALLALAQDALSASPMSGQTARRVRRLSPQIDPLSGWTRLRDGEVLPPSSLTQVLRSLPGRGGALQVRPVTPTDLRRFDLGRTSRAVSVALRELLGTLDGERCRFPGCTRRQALHAHHVVPWSQGGATDLANLVLVCSRHHTLVHAQGFDLTLHPDRRLDVATADGVPVRHLPERPWGDPDELDPDRRIGVVTLTPSHAEPRLDLRYVVGVLVAQAC